MTANVKYLSEWFPKKTVIFTIYIGPVAMVPNELAVTLWAFLRQLSSVMGCIKEDDEEKQVKEQDL